MNKKTILSVIIASAFSGQLYANDTTILSDNGFSGLSINDNQINAQTFDLNTGTVNTIDTGSSNVLNLPSTSIKSQNVNDNSYAEIGTNAVDNGTVYMITQVQ